MAGGAKLGLGSPAPKVQWGLRPIPRNSRPLVFLSPGGSSGFTGFLGDSVSVTVRGPLDHPAKWLSARLPTMITWWGFKRYGCPDLLKINPWKRPGCLHFVKLPRWFNCTGRSRNCWSHPKASFLGEDSEDERRRWSCPRPHSKPMASWLAGPFHYTGLPFALPSFQGCVWMKGR